MAKRKKHFQEAGGRAENGSSPNSAPAPAGGQGGRENASKAKTGKGQEGAGNQVG